MTGRGYVWSGKCPSGKYPSGKYLKYTINKDYFASEIIMMNILGLNDYSANMKLASEPCVAF